MAATFPGGVKVFTTKQAGDQIASAHINDLQAEVVAVETELRKTTGSVVSHGSLAGLSNNDHPQYLLTTGKAADADKLDGIDSTGFATAGHDHDAAYLGITAKAADSDKLDGIDSTGFATAGHDHDAAYLGITAKAADSDKLDGLDSTDFGRPVFLTTPLTSTAWDGNLFSTTSKTLIDLSSVFGVPAGVKAVLVRLTARDSGSSSATCQLAVSPNDTADTAVVQAYLQGFANNVYGTSAGVCPCDTNGDIYYQIAASGTNTLQAWIQIWGYWL